MSRSVLLLLSALFALPTWAQDGGAVGVEQGLSIRGVRVYRDRMLALSESWAPWQDGHLGLRLGASLTAPAQHWQAALHLGHSQALDGDWALHGQLQLSRLGGGAGVWDAHQGLLALSHRNGMGLALSRVHSPSKGRGFRYRGWGADLSWRHSLDEHWRVEASVGRFAADQRPAPFVYGHLGLSWQAARWQLRMARVHSDAAARRGFGERAHPHWQAGLHWTW